MRIFARLLLLACMAMSPSLAYAGGLELLPGGTRSLARGGAVAARPEDPMALLHNPAGLVLIPGNVFMLNIDLAVDELCVDPYGYYGWGVYDDDGSEFGDPLAVELDDNGDPVIGATYATTPLPEVCNSGTILPIPSLAWAGHITEDFSLGAGFVAPTVVTGMQFGGEDGTIATGFGAFPTPTRYQVVKQEVGAFAPSIGAGYRILPQLQVGANVQIVMLQAKARAIQNSASGTQPSSDWLAKLETRDYFVPILTFSVHSQPLPALDVMMSFRWADDFSGSGDVVYETNTFHDGSTSGPIPFENDKIDLALIKIGLPWVLTIGARYAGLLPHADESSGLGDPMDREQWDIEIDAAYSFNARASENRIRAGEDVTIYTREAGGGGDGETVPLSDLSQLSIDRHLQDSIAVRVGGSYSVMPRQVAMHGGVFFESRGVEAEYANIDSFAFQRLGFGLGVVTRLGDFDLMAAYGHIFQETLEVAPPDHQAIEDADPGDSTSGFDQRVGGTFAADGTRVGGTVLRDPDAPSASKADAVAHLQQSSAAASPVRPERVINAGKYTAAFNIVSIAAVYHF